MKPRTFVPALTLGLAFSMFPAQVGAQTMEYRLLATNRTSTMEEEMNQAAGEGFRVCAVMGGETAFGGREGVTIMCRVGDDVAPAGRYEYQLLATSRTSTMQEELQAAGDAGFEYVGQTVFRTTFGGQEVAVVLERDLHADIVHYEYLLLATNRTSTMQKELDEAGADGFVLEGMTVAPTRFGGNEVVAILRRDRVD
jgi:hypothetical protein